MKNRATILKELTSATILLALITSLLYISGATYFGSYLTEWGVEPTLITNSTQDILLYGAGIWIVGGAYVVIFSVAILIALSLPAYLIYDISKDKKINEIGRKFASFFKSRKRQEVEPPKFVSIIANWCRQAMNLILVLSISVYIVIELLNFSSSQGTSAAQTEYKEFTSGNVSTTRKFRKKIKIQNETINSYLIANSDLLAVVYTPGNSINKGEVRVVKIDDIKSIAFEK